MLFSKLLTFLAIYLQLIVALPAQNSNIDHDKVYPPDPPSNLNVLVGIRYFDSILQKEKTVDFVIALFKTIAPKAVENFKAIAKGVSVVTDAAHPEKVIQVGYVNKPVHKLIHNDRFETGQVIPNMGFCIYGYSFPDESFELKHDRPGRLSTVNIAADTNESKFLIDLNVNGSPERDNKSMVYGQVVSGLDQLLVAMQNTEVSGTEPSKSMIVEYMVIDELQIGNLDELHKQYKQDLKAFNDGDKSKGVTLKTSKLAKSSSKNDNSAAASNGKKSKSAKTNQSSGFNFHNFMVTLAKIILCVCCVAGFYLAYDNYKVEIHTKINSLTGKADILRKD